MQSHLDSPETTVARPGVIEALGGSARYDGGAVAGD